MRPLTVHHAADVWHGRKQDGGVVLQARGEGMIDILTKHAPIQGATHGRTTGLSAAKPPSFSPAKESMIDVVRKRCAHPGCNRRPTSGMAGRKTAYSLLLPACQARNGQRRPRQEVIWTSRTDIECGLLFSGTTQEVGCFVLFEFA